MSIRPRVREHPGWTIRVALRRWWKRCVRRHDGECCQRCGRTYDSCLWWAPGDLWWEIMRRESGLLCPRCFTVLARERGRLLVWRPMVSDRRVDGTWERDEEYDLLIGDDFLRTRLLALIDAAKGIEHTYNVTRARRVAEGSHG